MAGVACLGAALLEAFPAPGAVVRAGASSAATGTASRYLTFPAVQWADAACSCAYQGYGRPKLLGHWEMRHHRGAQSQWCLVLSAHALSFSLLALVQAGGQGEICRPSMWSHDLHTCVRGRAGSRGGLQAGALTPQHAAHCSCHSKACVPSPSCPALRSVWEASRKPGLQIRLCLPNSVTLEYLCGPFICSLNVY